MIKDWKSNPGLAVVITMAREIMNTGQTTHLEELIELMLGHETQQSAPLIASIAILIGDKVSSKYLTISQECNKALSDIILWDIKVITSKDIWPSSYSNSFIQLFSDPQREV